MKCVILFIFNPCAFLHRENHSSFENINIENQNILLKIDGINKAFESMEVKAKESEAIIQKLTLVESRFNQLNVMQNEINDKNKVIEDLTIRVNELEERTLKIEMLAAKKLDESSELLETSDPEKEMTEAELEFKCTKCEYVTTSEKGLKVHTTKTHTCFLNCVV